MPSPDRLWQGMSKPNNRPLVLGKAPKVGVVEYSRSSSMPISRGATPKAPGTTASGAGGLNKQRQVFYWLSMIGKSVVVHTTSDCVFRGLFDAVGHGNTSSRPPVSIALKNAREEKNGKLEKEVTQTLVIKLEKLNC